jgi:hypothetical protein
MCKKKHRNVRREAAHEITEETVLKIYDKGEQSARVVLDA